MIIYVRNYLRMLSYGVFVTQVLPSFSKVLQTQTLDAPPTHTHTYYSPYFWPEMENFDFGKKGKENLKGSKMVQISAS